MSLSRLFTLDTDRRLRTYYGYPTFYTTELPLACTTRECKSSIPTLKNCCNNKHAREFNYQYL